MAFRTPLLRLAGAARFYSRAASAPKSNTAATPSTPTAQAQREAGLPNPDPDGDSASNDLLHRYRSYMVATYARPPPIFVRGEGSYLWDMENRKYLDFTAGIAVNSLGHCDPQVAEVIAEQAKTLVHASNLFHNEWTGALSRLLVEKTISSRGMHDAAAAFICNSGSEANEAAIKFARKVGRALDPSGAKHEVVSFTNAFHGRTMGALSATPNPKYQAPFAPMVPGFRVGELNNLAALRDLVTPATCAVLVEPIQGEGGVRVATDEFLVALASKCHQMGAVLIHDEIQCGLSRTGDFWAHSRLGPAGHPDIVTTAKALGNGLPIGATVVSARVAEHIQVGDHGTTFGGNPLACRVAHHVVKRLASPVLQAEVRAKGDLLRRGLERCAPASPGVVGETRGRGLMLGLQLLLPEGEDPSPIVAAARERGLLIITAGTNTLRFVPSLLISEDEIREGLAILEEAIRVTKG